MNILHCICFSRNDLPSRLTEMFVGLIFYGHLFRYKLLQKFKYIIGAKAMYSFETKKVGAVSAT